jgi:hypothetical protein
MTNENNDGMILALAQAVQDTNKPEPERREALRHIAALRSEPTACIDGIPESDLRSVAQMATIWGQLGVGTNMSVADSADAVREARMISEARERRRE